MTKTRSQTATHRSTVNESERPSRRSKRHTQTPVESEIQETKRSKRATSATDERRESSSQLTGLDTLSEERIRRSTTAPTVDDQIGQSGRDRSGRATQKRKVRRQSADSERSPRMEGEPQAGPSGLRTASRERLRRKADREKESRGSSRSHETRGRQSSIEEIETAGARRVRRAETRQKSGDGHSRSEWTSSERDYQYGLVYTEIVPARAGGTDTKVSGASSRDKHHPDVDNSTNKNTNARWADYDLSPDMDVNLDAAHRALYDDRASQETSSQYKRRTSARNRMEGTPNGRPTKRRSTTSEVPETSETDRNGERSTDQSPPVQARGRVLTPTLEDRIILQRYRLASLRDYGTTGVADQGIEFDDDGYAYDRFEAKVKSEPSSSRRGSTSTRKDTSDSRRSNRQTHSGSREQSAAGSRKTASRRTTSEERPESRQSRNRSLDQVRRKRDPLYSSPSSPSSDDEDSTRDDASTVDKHDTDEDKSSEDSTYADNDSVEDETSDSLLGSYSSDSESEGDIPPRSNSKRPMRIPHRSELRRYERHRRSYPRAEPEPEIIRRRVRHDNQRHSRYRDRPVYRRHYENHGRRNTVGRESAPIDHQRKAGKRSESDRRREASQPHEESTPNNDRSRPKRSQPPVDHDRGGNARGDGGRRSLDPNSDDDGSTSSSSTRSTTTNGSTSATSATRNTRRTRSSRRSHRTRDRRRRRSHRPAMSPSRHQSLPPVAPGGGPFGPPPPPNGDGYDGSDGEGPSGYNAEGNVDRKARSNIRRYLRSIHDRIHQIIDERVGFALDTDALLRNRDFKIPYPKEYGGDREANKFDNWLKSLLRWMMLSQLGGPYKDRERIAVTGLYLTDRARDWFDDNVEGINRYRKRWTFKDVITGLYDYCVNIGAIQEATEKFYSAKYDPEFGVMGFYNELDRHARRMIKRPDSYTFKTQFMTRIPQSITNMLLERNILAESCHMNEILNEARAIEEGRRIKSRYHEIRNATIHTPVVKEASSKTIIRVLRKVTKSTRHPKMARRSESSGHHNGAQSNLPKYSSRPTNRDGGGGMRHQKSTNISSRPKGSNAEVICYSCGGKGHFASDPVCPKYQKKPSGAKLYAQRDIVDDSSDKGDSPQKELPTIPEGNEDESDREGEQLLNGSQYTSEGEEYLLEEYEEYSASENDQENERFAGLREIIEDDTDELILFSNEEEEIPLQNAKQHLTAEQEEMLEDMACEFTAAYLETGLTPVALDRLTAISVVDEAHAHARRPVVIRRSHKKRDRPTRSKDENYCLAAYMTIGNAKAFTMFDSGSTLESLSPEFTRVADIKVFPLTNQVTLQLGTAGSRSKVNYGAFTTVKYDDIEAPEYFDIANIDRYDCIVGTRFMRKHGISLDFEHNVIRVCGIPAPTLTEKEENEEIERRSAARRVTRRE